MCKFVQQVEQFTTDLILPGEEDFVFKLSGAYKVHLVGHYIMQPAPGGYDEPPHSHDHGDEYDSDEYSSGEDEDADDYMSESELARYDPETGILLDFDQDDSDDEIEADEEKIMELIEDKPACVTACHSCVRPPATSFRQADRRRTHPMHRPKAAKKEIPALKQEAKSAPAAAKAAEAAPADGADKSKLSKNQLKKLAKKEKDGEDSLSRMAPCSCMGPRLNKVHMSSYRRSRSCCRTCCCCCSRCEGGRQARCRSRGCKEGALEEADARQRPRH